MKKMAKTPAQDIRLVLRFIDEEIREKQDLSESLSTETTRDAVSRAHNRGMAEAFSTVRKILRRFEIAARRSR